jgi:hypothetical protein
MKRTPSQHERDWDKIAESLQKDADDLPPGTAKDAATAKAEKMRKAAELKNWLSSPGLRPCQGRIPET